MKDIATPIILAIYFTIGFVVGRYAAGTNTQITEHVVEHVAPYAIEKECPRET